MKRLIAALLVVVLGPVVLCLGATQKLVNQSGAVASGVVITFSEAVRITSYAGDVFPTQSPASRESESFTFSGGTLAAGGTFQVTWSPNNARVRSSEWITSSSAAALVTPVVQDEIPLPTETVAGIHAGGNWGENVSWAAAMPRDWLTYITALNANWVGISISMGLEDSTDSTVEIAHGNTPGMIVNFSDDTLRNMIRTLRSWGFHVYATLSFENLSDNACCMGFATGKYLNRWQLGDPNCLGERTFPKYWPWSPSHPDHSRFVPGFFRSYTEVAVRYGRLLEEEGAELYSLGNETDLLFRTRPSPPHLLTSYGPELKQMVEAVRAVYHGPLTYNMTWQFASGIDPSWQEGGDGYARNSNTIWGDLGLDVIGISAYFTLEGKTLRDSWEHVFAEYLEPLHAAYPGKPIVFTEFGYTDLPDSVHQANVGSFTPKVFTDLDKDGLDDGEETQAAIHGALFETMAAHPGVLEGLFLWNMEVVPESSWTSCYYAFRRCQTIRHRLAESVVQEEYGVWLGLESSRPAEP